MAKGAYGVGCWGRKVLSWAILANVPGVGGGEIGCQGSLKIAPTDLTHWGENGWMMEVLNSFNV